MVNNRIWVPHPQIRAITTNYSISLCNVLWYIVTYQPSSLIFQNFKVYGPFPFPSLLYGKRYIISYIANIGKCLAKSCPNLTWLSSVGGGSNDFPLTCVADMKSAKNHSFFAQGNTGATLWRGGGERGARGGVEACLHPLLCSVWQKRVAAPLKKK